MHEELRRFNLRLNGHARKKKLQGEFKIFKMLFPAWSAVVMARLGR